MNFLTRRLGRKSAYKAASAVVACEALESRSLLAANLPDGFVETRFSSGFNTPTSMEFAPDGRLFVTEKDGQVRVVKNGTLLATPFLSLRVDTHLERGLESIAFDPNFASNGYVYVYYTRGDNGGLNRLSRFTVSAVNPDVADPNSEVVLLDNVPSPTGYHNGGAMHFGTDGMLYLGIGDGGSRSADAQNLNSLSGKILRLNVVNYPNIIPADNPFVNVSGARGEVYAIGFRNPFTFAINPTNGQMLVNDVGAADWEEIDDVRAGGNYGWPAAEGMSNDSRFINPIYTYSHNGGQAAITGGVFYTGTQFPEEYRGDYLFADFTRQWIRRLEPGNGNSVTDFATGVDHALDIDVGPDGSIYYLSAMGDNLASTDRPVMRLSYGKSVTNLAPDARAAANKVSGRIPLVVKFTGSGSSDPDGDALAYTWNFGDGTPAAHGQDVRHVFRKKGTFNVVLTVSDGKGGISRSDAIRVVAGNVAPRAIIKLPVVQQQYRAGDLIVFSGNGLDREDGALPARSFEWNVTFHHRKHTHPFIESIPGVKQGTFRIPRTGEVDPVQFYRISLTVTDSAGVRTTSFVDVRPRTSRVTLRTNVPGLTINLDSQPRTGPYRFVGVEGMQRLLTAPATQVLNGVSYEFVRWSDGGAAEHSILTPVGDKTLTAVYRAVGTA